MSPAFPGLDTSRRSSRNHSFSCGIGDPLQKERQSRRLRVDAPRERCRPVLPANWRLMSARPYAILPPSQMQAARGTCPCSSLRPYPARSVSSKNRRHEEPGLSELPVRLTINRLRRRSRPCAPLTRLDGCEGRRRQCPRDRGQRVPGRRARARRLCR